MDELPDDVKLALVNARTVLQDWDADSPRRAELAQRILDNVDVLLGEEPLPGCGFCCRNGEEDYGHCGHDCHDPTIATTYANVRPGYEEES